MKWARYEVEDGYGDGFQVDKNRKELSFLSTIMLMGMGMAVGVTS